MTGEQWAIVGVLITIVIGLPAYFVAKKIHSNRQSQKISGSGEGYQAGRDIKIKKP